MSKANKALDKMAENARELGLDYEPVLKDNSNYRLDPPVAEPVAWKWQQAPVKTSWGHDMVVADLAIDKDHTVSVYCERGQKAKVETMFNSHTQTAPTVQEPVAYWIPKAEQFCIADPSGRPFAKAWEPLYTAPPAAQRQWVGLTDEEILKLAYPLRWQEVDDFEADKAVNFAQLVEAKLKEKNT